MDGFLVRMLAVALLTTAVACGQDDLAPSAPALDSTDVFTGNATVRFLNLEGGCWALETAQGSYEPAGLPTEFRQDGLRVYTVVRRAPHLISTCMLAPIVTIEEIRRQ